MLTRNCFDVGTELWMADKHQVFAGRLIGALGMTNHMYMSNRTPETEKLKKIPSHAFWLRCCSLCIGRGVSEQAFNVVDLCYLKTEKKYYHVFVNSGI